MHSLLSKVDSHTREKWLKLQEAGQFSLNAAEGVLRHISEQIGLGKNLDMIWDNSRLLPSLADELKYQNEGTALIKLIYAFNPIQSLAVGKNAFIDKEVFTDFLKTMILDDEELKKWKFADFRAMTVMAIKQEFGKIYDRVDSSVVFEWINAYRDRRQEKIYYERRKEQSQYNAPIHPEVAGKLAEIFKKYAKPEPESLITKKYSSAQDFMNDQSNAHMIEFWKGEYDERVKAGIPTRMTKEDYVIFKINQAINP